ncbi:MAG: hypothetical protein F2954_01800 [Actinobacteria bacterium]|uniref:Unannotated protein n=1 Tax=freshwater metagenome TaxID=449393 RepID=A0A6J7VNF1_9ZZZZ|nr:hypothetical protein [Actinomycetota bacterium]
MEIGVAEFAEKSSLSPRRVLQLIQVGKISARRSGGRWLIAQEELNYRSAISRPLSPKMGRALLSSLSGSEWEISLDAKSRSRIREYLSELAKSQDPARLLSSWFSGRSKKYLFKARSNDLRKLRSDKRIVLSGISDHRSGISDSAFLQGYVSQKDFKQVVREYLLVPAQGSNVQLGIASHFSDSLIPLGLMLVDLAEHIGPRESAQVKKLIRSL